jgi:protein tyrosine/serine phosphatase
MGAEAFWPWFSPEQFEAFFELMDDPTNFPVAVHCIGGRHRTGTFVALYRLEYQRWNVEDAQREMYA